MDFKCINQKRTRKETWNGHISSIKNYGSHIEIKIQSRSGILVLLGKTSFGNFACMPDYGAGCHLASLDDIFYNTERLTNVMNKVDGITVAYALAAIAEKYDF
jgi:hypothetical protein